MVKGPFRLAEVTYTKQIGAQEKFFDSDAGGAVNDNSCWLS